MNRKNIDTIAGILLISYMFVSVILARTINTSFNESFIFSFKYLFIPIVIINTFIVFLCRRYILSAKNGLVEIYIHIIITPVIITAFSSGYISLANIIIEPQTYVHYNWIVADKFESGTNHKQFIIKININDVDYIKIPVKQSEYKTINIGQQYKKTMKRGGLGILYH